ncbi:serine/threonine-protein phosphatase 4 regulatory subunit 2-A isoform X2 [Lingula anatina]|uniref:Serine/threonine-protein phosphatase 4 regulatory subunit 2-A isoform X2 n=1 Tax=Lingula anatina TaxID=7574 RepID=A0A1S3IDS6_LINAN|nr:serine/threonine-protein phosphatase 4 regulatory subunit 2-A isoform X2 [Lingula anatina]|eukprot:XP_013396410.1 serine/threonine-protein phosphatase 4 regulatory subunit 2-A isoform X2 [Lingula anatina]
MIKYDLDNCCGYQNFKTSHSCIQVPWPKLKTLLVKKLDKSMDDFFASCPTDELTPLPNVENIQYSEIKQRVLNRLKRFDGAPFTIQRLCELITEPKLHYKRTDKFIRGIEKNVMVVSTVDQYGNKIIVEPKSMVNGLDANGHSDESSLFTSPLPPISSPGLNAASWMSASFATNYPLHTSTEEGATAETSTNLPLQDKLENQDKPKTSETEAPSSSELEKCVAGEGKEDAGAKELGDSTVAGENLEELEVDEKGDTVKLSLAHWPQSSPEKNEQAEKEKGTGECKMGEGVQKEPTPDSSSPITTSEKSSYHQESNEADSTNTATNSSELKDQSQSTSEESIGQSDTHSELVNIIQSSDDISSQSNDAIQMDMPESNQSGSGSDENSRECEEPPRKMQRTDSDETEGFSMSLDSSSEDDGTSLKSSEDQKNISDKNSEQLTDVTSTSQSRELEKAVTENTCEAMDTD